MSRYYDDAFGGEYLAHYQVPGAKWGVRRYQNYDGSLTTLGREHYGIGERYRAEREYFKTRKSKEILPYDEQVKRRKKQVAKLRADYAKQQKAKEEAKRKNKLSAQDFDGYSDPRENQNERGLAVAFPKGSVRAARADVIDGIAKHHPREIDQRAFEITRARRVEDLPEDVKDDIDMYVAKHITDKEYKNVRAYDKLFKKAVNTVTSRDFDG